MLRQIAVVSNSSSINNSFGMPAPGLPTHTMSAGVVAKEAYTWLAVG
jgi:hypothetical protein